MTTLKDKQQALADWEEATNVAVLVFADDHPDVRQILLQARGDVREALGEGRS